MTNQTSGLGRRLVAEFVVIVLGVLVALAVDAAWDVRNERQRERDYYLSLARDLAADTAEYSGSISATNRAIEAAHHVRSAILGDAGPFERPLSRSLIYASWVNYPTRSSGTVEELFSAGTIRLIRSQEIKDGIHRYRTYVDEWQPRLEGPENSAFLEYRRLAEGLLPLEARRSYLADPSGEDGHPGVDELALARAIRGDSTLLRETETMIMQWEFLRGMYGGQRSLATELLNLLEDTIGGDAGR